MAAIVLAGGRSERFGEVDKLTVRLEDGATLLERAVAAVASVADDVVVVQAPGMPGDVPSPARAAHDPTPGEGPLAGLHAGLLAVVRSDVAIVVGGDMPDLQPPVLRAMLAALVDPEVELVALDDDGTPRPLPIVVRTWPAAEAAHALLHAGRRRLRDLLGSLRPAVLDEPAWTSLDPLRRTLRDVDEPEDLSR